MPRKRKEARFSPRAVADLEGIWLYTSETWSPDQAEIYHERIMSAVKRLVTGERSGHDCSDVRAGYFRLTAASHVIFFRERDYGYEIVRILHQSMDMPRHL